MTSRAIHRGIANGLARVRRPDAAEVVDAAGDGPQSSPADCFVPATAPARRVRLVPTRAHILNQ